jgi:hypothetical protein
MGTEQEIDKLYTILIRKWDIVNGAHISPSRKNLVKQMKTLHRKMKKVDSSIITYYSIEKDDGINRRHIHLLVYTSDIVLIKAVLMKYIKGSKWALRDIGDRDVDECNSKFGFAHIEKVIDIRDYANYISQINEYDILI